MILLRQRLQCIPLLLGGTTIGLLLALLARASKGIEPAMVMLMGALPFFLAALTGIAKTTTA